jgi:hypothetical protein
MKRVCPWLCLLLPLLLAAPVVFADAHLVLRDSQVLSGKSVELEGDLYLLTLESGDVLPLPVALVREVHRSVKPKQTGDENGEKDEAEELPFLETEAVPAGTREVSSVDLGVVERPRRLIELPDGGKSASGFSQSPVDPDWLPGSDYEENPMLGVFDDSFWPSSLLNPHWVSESGFELPEGEPPFRPDRWNKAAQRAIWKPKEGFASDDP